jgi:hypothetical protein
MTDLMLFSRIDEVVRAAGGLLQRVDQPVALPPPSSVDLVLIDWSARRESWGRDLSDWGAPADGPRMILFGQHTDLEAHRAARAAGLGPMWARSRLLRDLPRVVGIER